MRVSKTIVAGIACVLTGSCVLGGWDLWLQTRTTRPVQMPVSLALGEVTSPEFRVNLPGFYTAEIEAKKTTIPFDTLNCLLGMSTVTDPKCDRPSAVKATWSLTSGAVVVQTGTSDADHGGAWAQDSIARELGTFRLKKNQAYVLHVQFLSDGQALASADPVLKIEVNSDFYEGTIFESFLLMLCSGALIGIGVLMLVVSGLRALWRRKKRCEQHPD